MKLKDKNWIHIAGKPGNILKGTPPFWRYRSEEEKEEHTFDKLVVSGVFTSENNAQGAEVGEDFMLWYALRGVPTMRQEDDMNVLQVHLDSVGVTGLVDTKANTVIYGANVKIFGAPDLVRSGSSLWWRATVNDQRMEISSFRLYGKSSRMNNRNEVDIDSDNDLEKIWLEFHGDVYHDADGKHLDIQLI